MKILVIGQGCREHAIIKCLQEDSKVQEVYSLPERKSIPNIKSLPSHLLSNYEELSTHIADKNIDLVVVGPEQPLVDGISNYLKSKGIKVFGPSSQAARLEGSKIFSKQFMKEFSIPTASYQIVSSVDEVLKETSNFFPPFVLKADGLAGGKGVFICKDEKELKEKAQLLFEEKSLGKAGEKAVIEDFQSGEEISVFILASGEDYKILPIAKDYKRLLDGQKGPNTGGMGSLAPVPIVEDLMSQIKSRIIEPTLKGLIQKESSYCGILYIGLMIHKGLPKVLEYNVRFGDPEAQVLLPLLDGSWADVFHQVASGKMPDLKWKKQYAACVVLAAEGYPEKPVKGTKIEGSIDEHTSDSYFLHGGVSSSDKDWATDGGRVLNSIGIAKQKEEAIQKAYEHSKKVSWKGMQFRKDIGQ